MKKISVITPMYNGEAYIRQCIRSVQDQSEQNWEMVIIDDGSTDRGPLICEELSREDDRIRLYRQKNGGVSSARNKGLDLAEGEYVFFLDSDDMIHPRLLEEMVGRAEEECVELVFCRYTNWTLSLPKDLEVVSIKWKIADGDETQKWFHKAHISGKTGIGGKMIDRKAIGILRFDVSLINGEDTYFLYCLICRGIRAAFFSRGWYYYRIHQESVTHSMQTVRNQRYYESSRRIRDGEYRRGNYDYALTWELLATEQIEKNYIAQKKRKNKEGMKRVRRIAAEERKHPMFEYMYFGNKLLFVSCFSCYPLYKFFGWIALILQKVKKRMKNREKGVLVGILTFHCSDNYGAMLQAYGLKWFLQSKGVRTDIIRYEPAYMTGRHWWIPYSPVKGLRGWFKGILNMWKGFLEHIRMREKFLRRRMNMNRFRFRYLVDKRRHRVLFESGLRRLPYQFYVVGSDQIWNPDITYGLRKAYFGAFENSRKKKVISYAASFGSAALNPKYDKEFSKLIKNVEAVSVREEEAVPYVKRLCGKEVIAVLDPVFFLTKETWQKMEVLPKRNGFIFLYITERNKEMVDYAGKLSEATNLPVVEMWGVLIGTDVVFEADYGAGPSEFLGYLAKADYVVTNSFHAVAFSIIYQKKFLAFAHSNLGARVKNILGVHGLLEKLCDQPDHGSIDWQRAREKMDAPVDWDEVKRKTKEQMNLAGDFLMKNIIG